MTKKITLTLEKDVVDAAEASALKRGVTLSQLVEPYFRQLANTQPDSTAGIVESRVSRMRGAFSDPDNMIGEDYSAAIVRALEERHLSR